MTSGQPFHSSLPGPSSPAVHTQLSISVRRRRGGGERGGGGGGGRGREGEREGEGGRGRGREREGEGEGGRGRGKGRGARHSQLSVDRSTIQYRNICKSLKVPVKSLETVQIESLNVTTRD